MGSKKANEKAALKTAQSGTPVPSKDTSSSKSEKRADGVMAAPVHEKPTYEGSHDDYMADYTAAKRRGRTTAEYEDSAHDRIADAAGQRRMDQENKPAPPPTYKPGTPASANPPKAAHGFGHPPSARDGHLRCSGHGGAHRIGKKK